MSLRNLADQQAFRPHRPSITPDASDHRRLTIQETSMTTAPVRLSRAARSAAVTPTEGCP